MQVVDSEIYKLVVEKEQIPQFIKEVENNFKAKQELLKDLDAKLKTVQLKHKEKELDLSTKEEAIKKTQNQLYALKTNKEYQVKLLEIEGIKAECSLLEEGIIKILDEIDSANEEINEEKKNLVAQEKIFQDDKKTHQIRLKEIEDRLNVLAAQRKEISSKVEPKILKQYEKVLKNRAGTGIVLVKDLACCGCFMSVAPQVINEIKMNKSVITCPACQRILYLEAIVQD